MTLVVGVVLIHLFGEHWHKSVRASVLLAPIFASCHTGALWVFGLLQLAPQIGTSLHLSM